MRIILATGNKNKIADYRKIFHRYLGEDVEILSQKEVGIKGECEENGSTYEENALSKIFFVRDNLYPSFNYDIIVGDDSGLEVIALDNFPGLMSNRWMEGTQVEKCRELLRLVAEAPLWDKDGLPVSQISKYKICMAAIDRRGTIYKCFTEVEGLIRDPGEYFLGKETIGYDSIFYILGAKKMANCLTEEELFKYGFRYTTGRDLCNKIKEMKL